MCDMITCAMLGVDVPCACDDDVPLLVPLASSGDVDDGADDMVSGRSFEG